MFPERFCLEPRERDGGLASDSYLEIDRDTDRIDLISKLFACVKFIQN